MPHSLISYSRILEIVGDIVKVQVAPTGNGEVGARFGDLAVIRDRDDKEGSLAQVIRLERDRVSLQVFSGTKGLSTEAQVSFLGHPAQVTYSPNILGRVFRGTGEPMDSGPDLDQDPKVPIGGPSVNPARRVLASKMIRTDVPMVDVFNSLVESQKIPVFPLPESLTTRSSPASASRPTPTSSSSAAWA